MIGSKTTHVDVSRIYLFTHPFITFDNFLKPNFRFVSNFFFIYIDVAKKLGLIYPLQQQPIKPNIKF